jgi:curli biogenesis system outer membrane secretion channel CsgG
MISIVSESDRFSLIERSRLQELMKEQGLEGVVEPSELSKPGRVRGIDYLFLGAVTNFRVKVTRTRSGGGIWDRVVRPLAPLDIDTASTEVETQVGVDIRVVNTQTGEIVASRTGEIIHKAVAKAWGIRVLGIGGEARNELTIDEDSRGKILRHALHESYLEILRVTDEKFSRPQASYCPKCKQEIEFGKRFCARCGTGIEPQKCKCGATLETGARFCGECGAKVETPK